MKEKEINHALLLVFRKNATSIETGYLKSYTPHLGFLSLNYSIGTFLNLYT
jgi:hypothetical protein